LLRKYAWPTLKRKIEATARHGRKELSLRTMLAVELARGKS